MYQFKDQLNDVYFRFDKRNVMNYKWGDLPTSSKSILPVIGVHCNEAGIAWPSQETIGIKSGRTPKTVRDGIKGLESRKYQGFNIVGRQPTSRGQWQKIYEIDLPPTNEQGRSFTFYKQVVDGGNWSMLSGVSHALYVAMRAFGYFEPEEYWSLAGDVLHVGDLYDYETRDLFRDRVFDICAADYEVLMECAGISENSFYKALDELTNHYLIEQAPWDSSAWKVWLKPRKTFSAAWLNDRAMNRLKNYPLRIS
jgi:hypothetical protein